MMFARVAGVFSLGVVLGVSGLAAGQQGAMRPAGASSRIDLDVVVTPKSGAPVAGLQQSDFTVLDNKVARPITSFTAVGGTGAPVQVIVLVDAVNADFRTVSFARDQIDKFLLEDGGALAHPTTLAIFTDKGVQTQSAGSRDGKALSAELKEQTVALRTINRSAGFFGAQERLDLSLGAIGQLIAHEEGEPGRKIVLWVSPGWPLLSGPGIQLNSKQEDQLFRQVKTLSTAMRKARMTLYSIDPLGSAEGVFRTHYYETFVKGVSKPDQVDVGDLGLQVLAVQSGGLALASDNDITAMLRQAAADAKAYYEISFDAAPADGAEPYHQVTVQVAKPGLVARTRTGYYPGP